jgi:hypothetical protein
MQAVRVNFLSYQGLIRGEDIGYAVVEDLCVESFVSRESK